MRLMNRTRIGEERGFALPVVLSVIVITTLLVGTMAVAVNGDLGLTRRDQHEKQAYEAARAGIADYFFHLNNDTSYWARCTNVPTPNAVNQAGSTAKRRPVPGSTGATYAIELLPASGQISLCDEMNPAETMIEGSRSRRGHLPDPRHRLLRRLPSSRSSPPSSGPASSTSSTTPTSRPRIRSPTATSRRSTAPTSSARSTTGRVVSTSRSRTRAGSTAPRSRSSPTSRSTGPLHTNDTMAICGSPTFGRSPVGQDRGLGSAAGLVQVACGGNFQPNFVGTYVTNAPVLTPPPTNGSLRYIAEPAYRFSGQISIVLSGNSMTVTTSSGTQTLPVPCQRRRLRQQRRLLGLVLAVHCDLPDQLGLRQRLRAWRLLRQADDRRRERHRRRRRSQPQRRGPARPDREQLRPRPAPVRRADEQVQLRRWLERARVAPEHSTSTRRFSRSSTLSSSTTTTAGRCSET